MAQEHSAVLRTTEVPVDQLAGRAGRIVVGVDGSFGADAALAWAAAEARERGRVLDIVAVWEDLNDDRSPRDGLLHVARARLERAVESILRRRHLPKEVITAPLHGPPGEQLVARAEGADLLVLGTTGISSPEILGGIGLYCLCHTTVPIVFVPASPFVGA